MCVLLRLKNLLIKKNAKKPCFVIFLQLLFPYDFTSTKTCDFNQNS